MDEERWKTVPSTPFILIRFNEDLNQPDYIIQQYFPDNPAYVNMVNMESYLNPNSSPTVIVLAWEELFAYQELFRFYKGAILDLAHIMAMVHIYRMKYAEMLGDNENFLQAMLDDTNDKYKLPLMLPTAWSYGPGAGARYSLQTAVYLERPFNRDSGIYPDNISFTTRFITDMDNEIAPYLKNHNYIYRYYVYVKRDNYYVQANMGDLPISPEIFEIFNAGGEPRKRRARPPGSSFFSSKMIRRRDNQPKLPNILGWTKLDMVKAIDKARIRRMFAFPKYGITQFAGIARQDVGDVYNNGPIVSLQEAPYLPALPDSRDVPEITERDELGYVVNPNVRSARRTFSRKLYAVRSYYEEIYRRIYSTMTYTNWGKVCDINPDFILEKKETIKLEYGLQDADFEDTSKACKLIRDLNAKRKELVDQLVELVPFQSQAIKHDPNSIWVTSNVDPETLRSMDRVEVPKTPYEQLLVVNLWCKNDDIDKAELIQNLTEARLIYLFPADPEQYSKADICEYITESVKKEAEKYEFIVFDCSDPSIRKRHILNAMTIMGLGEVFKNIDYLNVTKEELCDHVNKYITILQETKAFNYASRVNPSFNK